MQQSAGDLLEYVQAAAEAGDAGQREVLPGAGRSPPASFSGATPSPWPRSSGLGGGQMRAEQVVQQLVTCPAPTGPRCTIGSA